MIVWVVHKVHPYTLIVFCRQPRLGHGKTRLAATIGSEAAFAIAQLLFDHTKGAVQKFNHVLWYEHLQVGDTLGDRLVHAQQGVSDDHHVLFIGSDAPTIAPYHIEHALELLQSHQAVMIPAFDGGFVLLGLQQRVRNTFEQMIADVPWSTDAVCKKVLVACKQLSIDVAQMEPHYDIDTEQDVRDVIANVPNFVCSDVGQQLQSVVDGARRHHR
jgi:uncharacterized protein